MIAFLPMPVMVFALSACGNARNVQSRDVQENDAREEIRLTSKLWPSEYGQQEIYKYLIYKGERR